MRILLVFLVVGCDPLDDYPDDPRPLLEYSPRREAPAPPTEKRPLAIDWKIDSSRIRVEATLGGGGKIGVSEYQGKYHITLSDVPKWSTWKVGAQTGRTDGTYNLIDIELGDRIATRTLAELENVDPEAELELQLQDGRTGKTKLPAINASYMVGNALKKAENGPVTFGKEPDDPKKTDSMFYPDGLSDKKWFGKAGKIYEIDWVLIVHKLPDEKGRRVCGGYTSGGKPAPDITLVYKDYEATIFNRRTGEVVEKKVFGPDKECPMFTMRRAGENSMDSYSPSGPIEAWARTRVKR